MAKKYSFKECEVFSLRIPRETYDNLSLVSSEIGISKNTLILDCLTEKYGGLKEVVYAVKDKGNKARVSVEFDLTKAEMEILQKYAEEETRSIPNVVLHAVKKLLKEKICE